MNDFESHRKAMKVSINNYSKKTIVTRHAFRPELQSMRMGPWLTGLSLKESKYCRINMEGLFRQISL